jgi:hypothetical protein
LSNRTRGPPFPSRTESIACILDYYELTFYRDPRNLGHVRYIPKWVHDKKRSCSGADRADYFHGVDGKGLFVTVDDDGPQTC